MKNKLVIVVTVVLTLLLCACGSDSVSSAVEVSETFNVEVVDVFTESSEAEAIIEEESYTDSDEDEETIEAEELSAEDNTVEYNVLLVSDDYVEITLLSISNTNVYFNITNVSNGVISVNVEHFQLDGAEYTYEGTGYASPTLDLVSGETRQYRFCDEDFDEISFVITNQNCSSFTGIFEIWGENGEWIENAVATNVILRLVTENELSNAIADEGELYIENDGVEYNVLLISDDYVEITLLSITGTNVYFSITNVSNDMIKVDVNHFQLDGVEYTYEGTGYASPMLNFAPGETRKYEFCNEQEENEIDFVITNQNCESFTGIFGIWAATGDWLENAAVTNVVLK